MEANAEVSELADFSKLSGEVFVLMALDVLPEFSLSFGVLAGALGFAAGFGEPPNTLRSMFHLPLPASSSGKSRDSIDMAETGRASGSDGTGLDGDGLRWCGFCTTPSNDRKGPLLAITGVSLRMMRKRRPGAGLQAVVDGSTVCLYSASS